MRKSVKTIIQLKGDELRLPQYDMVLSQIKEKFGNKDQELQATISGYVREESDEQRGYFFGVVIPSAVKCYNDRGYKADKEQMYLLLKAKFFYETVDTPTGVETIPRSMKKGKATLAEVKEFIDQVVFHLFHEFGYQVPPPKKDRRSLR